jgi:lipoprotein-anchoring transpeptidase ErfK/SrfK
MVLGLLAAATASFLWFRAVKHRYPWLATTSPPGQDANLMLAADTPGKGGEPTLALAIQPAPAAQPAPSAESVQPARPAPQPHPAPASRPASDKPVPRIDIPTTLPAYNQPANADPVQAADDLKTGLEALGKNDLLAARRLLSRAYQAGLPPADAQRARDKLADLAKETIFSPRPFRGDPLCELITVQPGDTLAKISARYSVSEDLLAAINNIKDKNLIRLGQHLKVMHGPWHAVVSKSRHLMDVYLQDRYVRGFRVGLGIEGSTPTGLWKVANHQEDPAWTDPRTGHRWHPSDPNNPIGEYWIGLEGIDGEAFGQYGYGIHGTIEPDSIGKDVSMGCIRLAPDDIALAYKLFVPGQSYVAITD